MLGVDSWRRGKGWEGNHLGEDPKNATGRFSLFLWCLPAVLAQHFTKLLSLRENLTASSLLAHVSPICIFAAPPFSMHTNSRVQ